MKNIGTRIAHARTALGLNQSELARRLQITPSSIRRWENGEALPRGHRLRELANVLGMSVFELSATDEEILSVIARNLTDARALFDSVQALAYLAGCSVDEIEFAMRTGRLSAQGRARVEKVCKIPPGALADPLTSFLKQAPQEEAASLSVNSPVNNNYANAAQILSKKALESDSINPALLWEEESELPAGEFVFIPRLTIEGACGDGRLNWHVESKGQRNAFRRRWVDDAGIKAEHCATITVVGDSMSPRICNGDSLVLDLSDTELQDGKVYAVVWADELLVKRIFKRHDGGINVVSDNADKSRYPDRAVPAHEVDLVRIVGRVVAISGVM